MRLMGSLGPTFVSWTLVRQVRRKLAFPLTVTGGFLTHLSQPLGALVTVLRAWRPTQTAHLPLSPEGLEIQAEKGGVSSAPRKRPSGRSEERRVGKECRSRWSPD